MPPTKNAPVAAKPEAETFTWKLADGTLVVVGKPGILKLKLRNVLTKDLLEDREMVALASACLSIQTVGGLPFQMRTPNEFKFFMDRFKSDADLDEFMNAYNQFVNPELQLIIDEALQEAQDQNLTTPDEIQEHVTKKVLEFQLNRRKKVQD